MTTPLAHHVRRLRRRLGWHGCPAVRTLLGLTSLAFIAQRLLDTRPNIPWGAQPSLLGMLDHQQVAEGQGWRVVSYLFLHQGWFHFMGNMAALAVIGAKLERAVGTKAFLLLYFFCGIVAALCTVASIRFGCPLVLDAPVLGASGALVGMAVAAPLLCKKDDLLVDLILFPLPFFWVMAAFLAWTLLALCLRLHTGGEMPHFTSALAGLFLGALLWWKHRQGGAPSGAGNRLSLPPHHRIEPSNEKD